jgi:GT2 family glycosyltransferase
MAKTSVFVLTCERPQDLTRCLKSVFSQSIKADEVVVVNNGNDFKTDKILSKYPVKIIKDSTKRLSYLFNLGWRSCKNEIIAFIADDAQADKKWLENIIATLQRYPKAGAVSGPVISTCFPAGEMHRLYLVSRKNWFYKFLAWPYLHLVLEDKVLLPGILCQSGAYTIGAGLKQSRRYKEMEVDLLTTTSMGIRKSALQKIKGFDENFCFNHADGDLFVRLKKAEYQLIFNPKIEVYHFVRLGPSRNPFFIGRDTGYFLAKDIRPQTFTGWVGYIYNICFLNLYWIYKAMETKKISQLKGISGFLRGLWDFLGIINKQVCFTKKRSLLFASLIKGPHPRGKPQGIRPLKNKNEKK